MSFYKTYEEALERKRASDARRRSKPRKPMGHGRKPIKRSKMVVRQASKKATVDGANKVALRDEMDQLVRDILKLRDSVCVTCPATEDLHVGHLFKRGKQNVRWNLLNVAGQCDFCNSRHNLEPEHYIEVFLMQHGEAAYNQLRIESNGAPLMYVDLLAIRDGLRAELERMKKWRES